MDVTLRTASQAMFSEI